ncbi:parkin coregulated gene protein-like [Uranotaenia lowii]|uniref:parkin coregulated gene protein-like n=1 Tax=Uranotaenia lowii TaxID=190385 RepID=UPI002478EA9F|nr:parkin coregulated gene protein-like [Uranotaenia lowii]
MTNCRCRRPCYCYRVVPAFSRQQNQWCTLSEGPPRIDVFRQQPPCRSLFRKFFLRGDIPIRRNYCRGSRNFIRWCVAPEQLDLRRYLPLFFDGMCEDTFPYREFARHGVHDILSVAKEKQVLCCLPLVILPMKKALSSKNPDVIIATLRAIQQLLQVGPCIGRALVPYYRQLLPIVNLFRNFNVNQCDRIDFKGGHRLGDVIRETLCLMEQTGGKDAYLNIKYMVPTYESCVLNR